MTCDTVEPGEFDCCECARHIIVCTGEVPPSRLCGVCQFLPGWFRYPQLRAMLDPEHDGLEIWERAPGPSTR